MDPEFEERSYMYDAEKKKPRNLSLRSDRKLDSDETERLLYV